VGIKALEEKGFRVNRSKTEYIEYKFDEKEQVNELRNGMALGVDEIKEVKSLKYLGLFV